MQTATQTGAFQPAHSPFPTNPIPLCRASSPRSRHPMPCLEPHQQQRRRRPATKARGRRLGFSSSLAGWHYFISTAGRGGALFRHIVCRACTVTRCLFVQHCMRRKIRSCTVGGSRARRRNRFDATGVREGAEPRGLACCGRGKRISRARTGRWMCGVCAVCW